MTTPYPGFVALLTLLCALFYRLLPAWSLLWCSTLMVAAACSLGLLISQRLRQYLRPEALGFDISAESWCFLHLAYHKQRPVLVAWDILPFDKMVEVAARHRGWQHLPISAACIGKRLLLRDVTIPLSAKSSALLDYELGYQFPWLGDEWMRTAGAVLESTSNSPLQRVSLALIKRTEYQEQLAHYQGIGLYPKALHLRSLAIWRCIRFLDKADVVTLILGFDTDEIYCTCFDGNAMHYHFSVFEDELYSALGEAVSHVTIVQRVIVYGRTAPVDSRLTHVMERLTASLIISTTADLWTADDIFTAVFGVSSVPAVSAAMLLASLGLALGEIEHGL